MDDLWSLSKFKSIVAKCRLVPSGFKFAWCRGNYTTSRFCLTRASHNSPIRDVILVHVASVSTYSSSKYRNLQFDDLQQSIRSVPFKPAKSSCYDSCTEIRSTDRTLYQQQMSLLLQDTHMKQQIRQFSQAKSPC